VEPRLSTEGGVATLAWEAEAIPGGSCDLLLASHPALLEPRGALAQLPDGGAAVVLSTAGSSEELAREFDPETRAALLEREIRVHWLPAPRLDEGEPGDEADHAASLALAGASVVTLCTGAAGSQALNAVATRLEAVGRSEAAQWLREGAGRVAALDPADLDPARHIQELDFRPAARLPQMPEPAEDAEARARWAEPIRRFHRTGKAGPSLAPGPFAWPAALGCLRETARETSPHPFVLVRLSIVDPEDLRGVLERAWASCAPKRLRDAHFGA